MFRYAVRGAVTGGFFINVGILMGVVGLEYRLYIKI
jgi:hypothetical protein